MCQQRNCPVFKCLILETVTYACEMSLNHKKYWVCLILKNDLIYIGSNTASWILLIQRLPLLLQLLFSYNDYYDKLKYHIAVYGYKMFWQVLQYWRYRLVYTDNNNTTLVNGNYFNIVGQINK